MRSHHQEQTGAGGRPPAFFGLCGGSRGRGREREGLESRVQNGLAVARFRLNARRDSSLNRVRSPSCKSPRSQVPLSVTWAVDPTHQVGTSPHTALALRLGSGFLSQGRCRRSRSVKPTFHSVWKEVQGSGFRMATLQGMEEAGAGERGRSNRGQEANRKCRYGGVYAECSGAC